MRRTAIILFLVLTALTGLIYPLCVTVIAQLVMPHKANGSLMTRDGKVIGSSLAAQKFESEKYFWPRPSSIDYEPMPSGGSNLGPTSNNLKELVNQRKERLVKTREETNPVNIPLELFFASGSGIDPHISPDGILYQIDRVAKARKLKPEELHRVVHEHIEERQLGLLGRPRINVLQLNDAIDRISDSHE